MVQERIQLKRLLREACLTELVDVAMLQRLQDGVAKICGISAIIRDLDGRPITQPSGQNRFCRLVMSTPYGQEHCRSSNRKAVKKAAAEHRIVKYVCHAGLSQFAAPIEVDGVCVGTIVMGDQPEGTVPVKGIAELARHTHIPENDLTDALMQLENWSEADMKRAVAFLQSITNAVAGLCYQGAELRTTLDELESLRELGKLLTGTLDLDKVLNLVAESATKLADAKGCSIRLIDPAGKELVIKSFYNLSRRYLDKGPVLLRESHIDQDALAGQVIQIQDMRNDPRVLYPKDAEREGIRSGIVLGLVSKAKPVGTLHLYTAERRTFEEHEVQFLRSLANQAAVAIENAQLYEQSIAKQELDQELRVARSIQDQLLPAEPPRIEGFDLAALSIPCSEVGGDFYDFVRVGTEKLAIVIADVAGKGIPGALLMASARAGLRAHLESTAQPDEVTRRLNVNLCHDTRANQFVSLFCGILNYRRRHLSYTNAGHNPPLLLRQGEVKELDKGGLVLGVEEQEVYEEDYVPLRSRDMLVFFTDGVTESLNAKGDLFGVRRLSQIVQKAPADAPAQDLLDRIRSGIESFAHGAPQQDDFTIIVIRVE